MEGTGTPQLTESGQRGEDGNVDFLALFLAGRGEEGGRGKADFKCRLCWGNFKCRLCLRFLQGEGEGFKSRLLEHEGRGGV
jgi:hypothetical protein